MAKETTLTDPSQIRVTQNGVLFRIDSETWKETASSLLDIVDLGSGWGMGQFRTATVLSSGPDATDVTPGDRILLGWRRLPIMPDPYNMPDIGMIGEDEILLILEDD